MTRLRLAIVEFSPSGGLYHFAVQFAEALARGGAQVQLVTGSSPELLPKEDVELQPILPTWNPGSARVQPMIVRRARRLVRGVRYVDAWRRVIVHVRRTRPDIIQLGNLQFLVDGLAVQWLRRLVPGSVLVDVAHTPRPLAWTRRAGSLHKSGWLLDRVLGRAYAQFDAVFVLGEKSRAELEETWSTRRVVVIPHGDQNLFAEHHEASAADGTPPNILFFGTWARYKGLDGLLGAFEQVRDRCPDARLVIAGAVAKDIDYGAVAARASAIGNVDLRPGYVPMESVPSLVSDSRLLVAPYRTANQSGVVHLAHTFRRPVVATAVGDLDAAIHDGVSGLLVPPGDTSALADALVRLLDDPTEARRLGDQGWQHAREHGSWDVVAEKTLPVIEELVRTRRMR